MKRKVVRKANLVVLEYLEEILKTKKDDELSPSKTEPSHLLKLIQQARTKNIPNDKLGRWVGFIQGVMVMRGWIDVEEERDRTRPIFKQAYNS